MSHLPRAPQTSGCHPLGESRRTGADVRLVALRAPAPPISLSALFARLPAYPPALLAAVAANVCIGSVLNARNLPAARGKVVALEIRDAGVRLAFAIENEGLLACRGIRADATISASARDFLALARRTEDADTLFFARRLVMEGDTELALLIRNTLDAIDFRSLKPFKPWRMLAALALQLRSFR